MRDNGHNPLLLAILMSRLPRWRASDLSLSRFEMFHETGLRMRNVCDYENVKRSFEVAREARRATAAKNARKGMRPLTRLCAGFMASALDLSPEIGAFINMDNEDLNDWIKFAPATQTAGLAALALLFKEIVK